MNIAESFLALAGGGLIPDRNTVERLIQRIEIQTDTGGAVLMEIK